MPHRNICQNVNVTSLEDVIKYFLQQSHAKAEQAQAQADVRGGWCLVFGDRCNVYVGSITQAVMHHTIDVPNNGCTTFCDLHSP